MYAVRQFTSPSLTCSCRFATLNLTKSLHKRNITFSSPRRVPESPSSAATKVEEQPHAIESKGKQKESLESIEKLDIIVEEDRLPFLQRPLGVKDRPTTVARSWREDMMDQETRIHHREKLVKAAAKGYYSDLNATRRHGGKTWVAPKVLIREDKALYFPDIAGTPLTGGDKVHTTDLLMGKVTILSILSSKISEAHSEILTKPTLEAYGGNPLLQTVEINLQENLLKSLLVSLFARSIRSNIPEEQWGRYLISSQNMDYVRDDLGFANRHVGYVYLIDKACRIRWAACADPMPEEVDALQACTAVLLKRQGK